MALRYGVGDRFPSATLVDDRGETVTIEAVASGQPLILAFFRGPW